ncbi:hypothetical protein AB0K00_18010 [Dactylosporangium sp. NPDC049525]|uniref:FG-GAP repeat protein n=1 Tax=Dactylosporangium sp. NPDC049525 TaxID=3154730 RepID=UPI00341D1914
MTRRGQTWPVIVSALTGLALMTAVEPAAAAVPGRGGAATAATTRMAVQALTDFDGDGLADLVVGSPFEEVDGFLAAGGVNIIYGTSGGLDSAASFFISQNTPGVFGDAEQNDEFGAAVATGDFDGDGYTDLAIGVPGEDWIAIDDGFVHVLYGGPGGLTTAGSEYWSQDSLGIYGGAENFDGFGQSLAAADFGNGLQDDLAVGVPLEDVDGQTDAGGVNVIYGTTSGLSSARSFFFSQNTPGMYGVAESYDRFGFALAAADFGDSSHADLAISVPYENNAALDDGGVHVIAGGPAGLNAADSFFWCQDSTGVEGTAQDSDLFGYSLAAADFGGTSYADLAVGVPYEDEISGLADAGAVNVLYGSSTGLTATGDQLWSQYSLSIAGDAAIGDHFGYSLAAADFGNGSYDDLAIGVPSEDVSLVGQAGGVNVIYGSSTGLDSANNAFWSQASSGVIGIAEGDDLFGYSLAAADFGNGSYADLAIGVPFEDSAATDDGSVNVLYGSSTGLGTADNQSWYQGSSGIFGDPLAQDRFGFSLAASA